ncbi:phosphomannomutase [uncultured Psychrobacter sp.]|uniref:phosphomannomutase n=1 Tax=uncultured Psychrobacter sp. TaxID=259303 RepID=UPI002606AFF2|nr:phosphomannomutase [uncultured Psychrobacter sp.]
MPTFAAQLPLFRAYDIRGARQYFTTEFIAALGEVFAQLYKAQAKHTSKSRHLTSNHLKEHDVKKSNLKRHTLKEHYLKNKLVKENFLACPVSQTYRSEPSANVVVIGYDVRCDSDTIAHMLASRLSEHGLTVIQLGLITTPMMAFWAQQYAGHGIIVTASHSEKNTLGIKWLVDNASPSDADIQAIYKSLTEDFIPTPKTSPNPNHQRDNKSQDKLLNNRCAGLQATDLVSLPTDTVVSTYIDAIAQVFTRIEAQNNAPYCSSPTSKLDLKIVIDCLNGATSRIAKPLFERFCQQVIVLNDIPDGNFPTGNPDPTEPNRLAELQQTVIINEADMGLAFDGDGDRLMIVDNSGKVVTPDHLLYLLARVAIIERPRFNKNPDMPQVLFDVKCSHHLPRLLKKLDAIPVMSKTGSSLLRQQLQSHDNYAIFAGELSGHFIFNDDYFIVYDDAMYAGLRLLHWLASTVIKSDMTALLGNETNFNTHTLPPTYDAWGARRRATLPYRLTDITWYLPTLVSTADNYLPLPENATTTCSIVHHLTILCRYLQHLVEDTDDVTLPSCHCFDSVQQITPAQAERLLPKGTLLTRIDGVRLDFAHGFGVLRQSNTSHSLTVRFAGDSLTAMAEVQTRFIALCQEFDTQVAEQIAAISAE